MFNWTKITEAQPQVPAKLLEKNPNATFEVLAFSPSVGIYIALINYTGFFSTSLPTHWMYLPPVPGKLSPEQDELFKIWHNVQNAYSEIAEAPNMSGPAKLLSSAITTLNKLIKS